MSILGLDMNFGFRVQGPEMRVQDCTLNLKPETLNPKP